MGIIKSIERIIKPDQTGHFFHIEAEFDFLKNFINSAPVFEDLINSISDAIAKKYVDEFGAEILKRIQEKTIEAKVIQKVISNLKKEIGGQSNEARPDH
jgi:hypothetical protein